MIACRNTIGRFSSAGGGAAAAVDGADSMLVGFLIHRA